MKKPDEELKGRLEGVLDESGTPPVQPPVEEIPPAEQPQAIPPSTVAQMLINYFNDYRAKHGLGPMNEVQTVLIRAGIIGSAEKYNMTFDVVQYPELAALVGVAWAGFDTITEIKQKTAAAAQAAKQKTEQAQNPEPEKAAA